MGRSHSSLSTKVHVVCDALGYPRGFILTAANVSDFDQAKRKRRPGYLVVTGSPS